MTHDAATIAGINRRIAEYEGYTDIEADPQLPGIWTGRLPEFDNPVVRIRERTPQYWNSSDAILPVVERLCRERGLSMSIEFAQIFAACEDEQFWCILGERNPGGREWKGWHKNPAAAAALACAAVIDAMNNERTSE